MADKIKAFFRQKKAEAKFKTAGGGQKLGDSSKTSQSTTQQSKSSVKEISYWLNPVTVYEFVLKTF